MKYDEKRWDWKGYLIWEIRMNIFERRTEWEIECWMSSFYYACLRWLGSTIRIMRETWWCEKNDKRTSNTFLERRRGRKRKRKKDNKKT